MKRKFVLLLTAGAASLVLVSLNSTSAVTPVDEVLVNDWIVVGSPSTHFTPGQSSLSVGGAKATGAKSVASGNSSASGDYSAAVGTSYATGYASFSSGYWSTSSGWASAAFGTSTSSGYSSFAAGESMASGYYSSSFGWGTVAEGQSTLVVGQWNDKGTYDPLVDSPTALHPDGHSFVIGNGDSHATRTNALVTKWSGETTLTNKYWDSQAPVADAATDPYGAGEALVVEGHAVLKGKVVLEQPQGDISMGVYGQ